jgi:hypothetical protein
MESSESLMPIFLSKDNNILGSSKNIFCNSSMFCLFSWFFSLIRRKELNKQLYVSLLSIQIISLAIALIPMSINSLRSFSHKAFNIYTADLVNRKARRKPLAEQELRNLPEHPISSPFFFNRIRVA